MPIVYSKTKKDFLNDVLNGDLNNEVYLSYVRELGQSTNQSQKMAWSNSLQYMSTIMQDPDIPQNSGVAIEYKIPRTTNRIDFIITGTDEDKK